MKALITRQYNGDVTVMSFGPNIEHLEDLRSGISIAETEIVSVDELECSLIDMAEQHLIDGYWTSRRVTNLRKVASAVARMHHTSRDGLMDVVYAKARVRITKRNGELVV